MSRYAKAIAALLTSLAAWGATAAPDGYSAAELWGLLAVAGSAIAVYAVANKPPAGKRRRRDVSETARDA